MIKAQTTHDDKKIVFMLSTTRISAEWSVISEFQNTSEKITVKFSKKHSDWMCMYMCACVCDYVVWWGYCIKFIMGLCLLLWWCNALENTAFVWDHMRPKNLLSKESTTINYFMTQLYFSRVDLFSLGIRETWY